MEIRPGKEWESLQIIPAGCLAAIKRANFPGRNSATSDAQRRCTVCLLTAIPIPVKLASSLCMQSAAGELRQTTFRSWLKLVHLGCRRCNHQAGDDRFSDLVMDPPTALAMGHGCIQQSASPCFSSLLLQGIGSCARVAKPCLARSVCVPLWLVTLGSIPSERQCKLPLGTRLSKQSIVAGHAKGSALHNSHCKPSSRGPSHMQ